MKQNEYNDMKGFESINTPRQLDQFEAIGSKSLEVRNIFDFSNGIDSVSRGVSGSKIPLFKNLVRGDDIWDISQGVPGHAALMLSKKPVWSNDYPDLTPYPDDAIPQDYFITSKVPDINNITEVPYWDENALIYLDEARGNIYYDNASNNSNNVREFRSGYIELTIKTNKQNCIIGLGTTKKTNYGTTRGKSYTGNSEAERSGSYIFNDSIAIINNEDAYLSDGFTNSHSLYINIKNGKLNIEYYDDFGPNKQEFSILGNTNIADDNWHHIVINFGKPGIVRNENKKFNERFIEFWIDGKLDKRTKEYVNNSQIYFPTIDWLLMDPLLIDQYDENKLENSLRYTLFNDPDLPFGQTAYYTYDNTDNLINREFDTAKITAFKGSIHHYVAGINNALDKNEIQKRYAMYCNFNNNVNSINVTAEIIDPIITSNKKKALKLFWNNLSNENTNGLELDNNFNINTLSMTHKIKNSISEIYNLDKSISRKINFLPDVKVVLKDNILLLGPGKELLYNRSEVWNAQIGDQIQLTPNLGLYDGLNSIDLNFQEDIKSRFSSYAIQNILFSGISLNNGDRILLVNQINKKENGIYIFNGLNKPLIRDESLRSPSSINNGVVRVIDGYYKNTSWMLSNTIESLNDVQIWLELEFHPKENDINTQPIFTQRWTEANGEERFIDLEQDININNYDLIVFMNYPETNEQIKESFIGYDDFEIKIKYDNFIKSLKTVVANGANLYVSSPKLAEDLGIVKKFTEVPQLLETTDAASSSLSPFELSESANRYFDTHRNNKYNVANLIPGLTDKETYLLTDFINFIPESEYDYDQYHAKYSYRQFGLQEGNEFIIPGSALRKVTENENLPGFRSNQLGTKSIMAVAPSDILAGTLVTKLANNYYNGSTATSNPYDDYGTTIVVHNGQLLGGTPINGKIFMNCVEDGYTFSREEYNKAVIQVIPQNEINETVATRAWQYSTTRLNRLPQRINISNLTNNGQTTPTNGGGGAFIQAPSNASNGVVRSLTDKDNKDYQSDLYPTESEEIYPLQEIPVLSMTWLGLQWLAE